MREQIIRRPSSGNLFERVARVLKIGENEFLGHAGALFVDRGPRSRQRLVRFLEQRDVTQIRDGRPIAGLHGMWATVSADRVQRPTCAPSRAAAYAASTPA